MMTFNDRRRVEWIEIHHRLAFLTLCIILLNTFWGVIFFTSLDEGGAHQFVGPVVVVLTHMLFSCLVCSPSTWLEKSFSSIANSSRRCWIEQWNRPTRFHWSSATFYWLVWSSTRSCYVASNLPTFVNASIDHRLSISCVSFLICCKLIIFPFLRLKIEIVFFNFFLSLVNSRCSTVI